MKPLKKESWEEKVPKSMLLEKMEKWTEIFNKKWYGDFNHLNASKGYKKICSYDCERSFDLQEVEEWNRKFISSLLQSKKEEILNAPILLSEKDAIQVALKSQRKEIKKRLNKRKIDVIVNKVAWNEEGRREGNWELGYDDASFDFGEIISKLKDEPTR